MTRKKAFSSSRRQRCLCLLLLRAWTVTRDSSSSSYSFVDSLLITTRSTTSIVRLGPAQHHNQESRRRRRRRRGVVFVSHDDDTASKEDDDAHSLPTRRSSVSRGQRLGRLQAYDDSQTTMTTDHASSEPPFPFKLYQISSALMGSVALLLLLYFPQVSSSSSTSLTRWQRSQFNLGTPFGAASGFGMAAYLFYWLGGGKNHTSKERGAITQPLPTRLSRLLHVALLFFCGVGIWAIPGEAGLLLRRNIVDMPFKTQRLRSQVIASWIVPLLSTIARGVGLWTAIWGWNDLKDHNNTCTTMISHDDEEEGGQEADECDSLDKVTDKLRVLDFPADMLVASRIFQVSKRHRKHGALFYRNALLLVLCGAGSNLMDIIFQLRVSPGLETTTIAIIALHESSHSTQFFSSLYDCLVCNVVSKRSVFLLFCNRHFLEDFGSRSSMDDCHSAVWPQGGVRNPAIITARSYYYHTKDHDGSSG